MKMLAGVKADNSLNTFLFGLIILHVVTMGAGEQQSKLQANEEMCYQKMAAATYTDGLYCNITWDRVMCWDRTPAGSIARQPCADYINTFDTAQFATRECLSNGTWQPNPNPNMTIGYTDYTACLTKHSVENIQDHISRIQLITDIGYGISLASLIIAELIMIFSKRLHCKSNTLHINLFFAFILRAAISLIQNVSFVQGLGFEKDIIRKPGGGVVFNTEGIHWECKLLMTLFIYALTASQMWIFVEGLYLHMLVYRTLFTERHGIRLYVFLGWGLPLIYLIPWILVRIFVDDMFCWTLYKEKYFVWIIKAPIVLSVLVNSFFFVSIVLVLCRRVKFHRYPKGSSQHFRKIAKFAIVLIPLFGVIYLVFAPFPTDVYPNADMIMLYCEMFYNSIQGFILATLFCFLNEEVQNQIRWWCYQRRQDGHHTRTMFMSSMRKSTNHSRTLMSRDPNMAGGAVYMNGGRNGETKLKWTTSRRSSSKTDQRNDTLKDTAYNRHWECKLLMTLFIYALTASQMWIFVEGLYLHMLVYRTLFTERHGIRLYVFLGWGLPLIYLIPWILVRIFVDDMFCWTLYKEKYFVWIIKAPIVLSVLVNSFFFVSIVLVLCRRVKFHRYPKGSSQHFRKIAKFAIVLIPLFGVIYLVFAPFPTDVYPNADMIMLYCEMFYNSIQGFILATLFCFLNEEVQNQIRWWCYQRRQDGHHTRTMFMSSMRKSTNHSRTLMSRDPNMAGGAVYMNGGRNGETKLKWTTSRRSSSKTDQRNDTLKDTAYNRVICQDVDGSTCTIDTV